MDCTDVFVLLCFLPILHVINVNVLKRGSDIVTALVHHILGLMGGPRLADQSDLGSKASGSSIFQKTRHRVVVQVVDEVPDPGLVCCSQLICSQRRQRGTRSPGSAAITVTGRAQGQLRLETKKKKQAEKEKSTALSKQSRI